VIQISKLIATIKSHARALYATLAIMAVAAVLLPAAALATEPPGPAEPSTTDAATIAGEGAKSLIAFLWAVLPYLIGVAIVMFIARWLMSKFGFGRK
jgi:hypothetical protein